MTDPPVDAKRRLLSMVAALGVDTVNLGLPAAGPRAAADVAVLARHVAEARLPVRATCAARTLTGDIVPILETSQRVGLEIEVSTFLGVTPLRQYVEDWPLPRLLEMATAAVSMVVREGLPATFVTEDTVRASPGVLEPLFLAVADAGASRVCLCDTAGHATPDGTRALVEWTLELFARRGLEMGIDWHGHNDRGLALGNSLVAARAGADRIHGTALGIGERVGNTPLDLLLLHLAATAQREVDLDAVRGWSLAVSEAMDWPLPARHPLFTAPESAL